VAARADHDQIGVLGEVDEQSFAALPSLT
jgi:hypothetical protein